jgi:Fe-S-cluster containining protein
LKNCQQCGTCCRKGGPALHRQDLYLIQTGILPISRLVTIRNGEPVFSPVTGLVEPARQELLKLSASNSWSCPLLNPADNNCEIYDSRPSECRLLKCWDTAELKNCIYQDNINRWDIIPPDSDIFPIVQQHEKVCTFADIEQSAQTKKPGNGIRSKINVIIERDLSIREQAVSLLSLSLEEELFYFGRPMFTSLEYYSSR